MTLLELIFVLGILALSVTTGIYGFVYGGIWIAISSGLAMLVVSVCSLELFGKIAERAHKSRLKLPCGVCRYGDYEWIGQDEKSNPIAKCKCGKSFILIQGVFDEMKPM